MKNITFIPNRTNLKSAQTARRINNALANVIHNGHEVDFVTNRHGRDYLKIKADRLTQKTKYDVRVYAYTHSGEEVEITRNFWKEYGKTFFDHSQAYRGSKW
jgi:negative regulator of genetic competence, sporulation and motility